MEFTRRYDIDWLRNLGILLLFPFHSARVFDHWDPFYVKSDTLSWGLSWFISGASFWFMPLLFWLAGSSSWYALQLRSRGQYLNDRHSRLMIPFLFGLLFIVPPQGFFSKWQRSGEVGNYFSFLRNYFSDFSDLSGYFGSFTPAHLWFILYLFVLSWIALPLFMYLKNNNSSLAIEKFHSIFSRTPIFILFCIVVTATQALPAPGGQNPFYFFVIMFVGYISASHPNYQMMFNRIRFKVLLALVVLIPGSFFLMYNNQHAPSFSSIDIFMTFLRTLNMWLALIVILGYGNKYLNFSHKFISYMNEAAFPIYIVHQSVLVVIGFYILKFKKGVLSEFLLIMVFSFIISLLLYEFIIKRTAFTRWVFGVKIKNKVPDTNSVGANT